jgi:hypothetical protein
LSPHWRPVSRLLKWQLGALTAGFAISAVLDLKWALAFACGALVCISGHFISARLALRDVRQPFAILVMVFAGTLFKWIWVATWLYLGIAHWRVSGLGLVVGVVCMQLATIAAGIKKQH